MPVDHLNLVTSHWSSPDALPQPLNLDGIAVLAANCSRYVLLNILDGARGMPCDDPEAVSLATFIGQQSAPLETRASDTQHGAGACAEGQCMRTATVIST